MHLLVDEKPSQSRLIHWNGLIAFLFAIALWLLNHRYAGIWHDARIYTLMAVHELVPQQFIADPWFSKGAADGFSIFPSVYAWIISKSDIAHAAKFLVALGALLWLGSTYCFCYSVFQRRQASLLFLLLSCVPLAYSPDSQILVVCENFVTSRIFAIPLVLAALSAALSGYLRVAVAALILAIFLHPLVAIWGVGVVLIMTQEDRKVAIGTTLGASAFILLLSNPLHLPALEKMPPDWQEVVRETAVIVFHKIWPEIAVEGPLWWLAALLLAARLGTRKLSRLYLATAHIGSFALLASLIVSYYTQNTLLVQIQPWRALWLVAFFGFVAAIDLACATFNMTGGMAISAFLLATFLLKDSGGAILLLCIAVALAAKPDRFVHQLSTCGVQLNRVLWKAIGCLILLYVPGAIVDAHIFFSMDAVPRSSIAVDNLAAIGHQLQWGLLPILCWHFLKSEKDAGRLRATLVVALVAVGFAWIYWDGRSNFQRYAEGRYKVGGSGEAFSTALRAGETVYWLNNPLRVWFDVGAPSYVSSVQAIGIVFSYDRMKEVKRRLEHVGLRNDTGREPGNWLLDSTQDLHRIETRYTRTTSASARHLCSDSALGYFIDQTALPGIQPAGVRTEMIESRQKTYYLYDCRSLR